MRIAAVIAFSCVAPVVAYADEPTPDDSTAPVPTPPPSTPAPDSAPTPPARPEPAPMPPSAVAPTPTITNHGGDPTDRFGNPILAPAEPPVGSRRAALVATGITGALVVSAFASYLYADKLTARQINVPLRRLDETCSCRDDQEKAAKFLHASIGLMIGATVSAAVTGYLWTRAQPAPRRLLVHPIPEGAAVSYLGRF